MQNGVLFLLEGTGRAMRTDLGALAVELRVPGYETPVKAAQRLGVDRRTIERAIVRLSRRFRARDKMQRLQGEYAGLKVPNAQTKAVSSSVQAPPAVVRKENENL
jgi:hypothetical protein